MSLLDLCGEPLFNSKCDNCKMGGITHALQIFADALWYLLSILMRSYYCPGPPEQFDNWLSSFSLEDKKGEISELLVNSPSIRALYTKMVCIVAFVNIYSFGAQPPVM